MTQGLVLGGNLTMYLLNLFIILRAVEAHVASVALRACVWSLDTSIASASDICIAADYSNIKNASHGSISIHSNLEAAQ